MQQDAECSCVLKEILSNQMIDQYKNERTEMGNGLVQCTKAGFENHADTIGLIAADVHAYTVFADLFNLVIDKYHGFGSDMVHCATNWGTSPFSFEILDADYVSAIQFICRRSVESFPFLPTIPEEQLKELDSRVYYLTILKKKTY